VHVVPPSRPCERIHDVPRRACLGIAAPEINERRTLDRSLAIHSGKERPEVLLGKTLEPCRLHVHCAIVVASTGCVLESPRARFFPGRWPRKGVATSATDPKPENDHGDRRPRALGALRCAHVVAIRKTHESGIRKPLRRATPIGWSVATKVKRGSQP
jgi:hypothetical protein